MTTGLGIPHIDTHTKAKCSHYTAFVAQFLCTSTGMPGTTQTLKPCAVNLPGVTHKRSHG